MSSPHRKTLKNEILIFDTVVVLVIFMLVITSTIFIYLDIFYNEIMVKNDTIAKSMTYQINEHSEMHIKGLENFAYNFEHHLLVEKLSPNILLANLNANDTMFIKVQILTLDGIVEYSSDKDGKDIGLNLSNQSYVQVLKETGDYQFSNSFLSRDVGQIVTAFAMRTEEHIYLVLLDLAHFNDHLNNLGEVEEIQYMILDQTGTIIAATDAYYVETRTKYNTLSHSIAPIGNYPLLHINDGNYLINTSSSELLGWTVVILNDDHSITAPVRRMVFSTISITFFALIVYLTLKRKRINRILDAINDLKSTFSQLAKGNYKVHLRENTYREFDVLSEHFNHSAKEIELRENTINRLNTNLEGQVAQRTVELQNKNDELNAIVDELQSTQEMLIESEKQAAFSKLIAGIAHEINTPIGVSITSITFLIHKTERIKEKFDAHELSEEEFNASINDIHSSAELIYRNLERASDLIASFKSASGNSFHDYVTEYDLKELVNHLVKSMNVNLDTSHIHISYDIPEDCIVRSYPAAMSQILTNLIGNSVDHGFKENDIGHISIKATLHPNTIELVYEDDGQGITREKHDQIFEPFFTTNRLNGGTGLGLSIVKNLVVNKLAGTLKFESEVNHFTRFIIQIPR